MSNAQVFDTAEEIEYARLAMVMARLKLEAQGLQFRGGATRPKLAAEFGLKPRAPFTAYIGYCETRMAQILANKLKEQQA